MKEKVTPSEFYEGRDGVNEPWKEEPETAARNTVMRVDVNAYQQHVK